MVNFTYYRLNASYFHSLSSQIWQKQYVAFVQSENKAKEKYNDGYIPLHMFNSILIMTS